MGDATPGGADPSRALLMGVSRFAPAVAEGEEPLPGVHGWDELPFVPDLMSRLEQAYSKLAYDVTAVREPDRKTVRRSWTDASEEQYRIVHVISHGTTMPAGRGRTKAAEGSERLAMVPSCGDTGVGTDVSLWVQEANGLPHPMLFLVDLCRAGRTARIAQLAQIPDDQLHAWVIAATSPDRAAYDGAFSTAVAEVLEEIAANGLDTSPLLRYVRWDRVTSAIQLRLSEINSRQKVHSTKVDTSQPLELPFFANPNWVSDPRLERLQAVEPLCGRSSPTWALSTSWIGLVITLWVAPGSLPNSPLGWTTPPAVGCVSSPAHPGPASRPCWGRWSAPGTRRSSGLHPTSASTWPRSSPTVFPHRTRCWRRSTRATATSKP